MTKRDLQQYRSLCGEINAIKDEIERLQTFVQSPQLAGLHRGGGHPDRVGGLVVKKVDLENRLLDKVEQLYMLRQKIESAIERLGADQRLLLRYRYIEGMPWESICIKMHYQWAQIHWIHAKAVQALQDDTQ